MFHAVKRPPNERQCIFKSEAPDCSGAFALELHPPLERMSVLFTAFRSSNSIVVEINVALTRWVRRVAFVGTAARARPGGHAFFMFRFLARGSAGTDVSFIGRAGRGLVLSRRNERRAEERRNDKSRDCKFGSHQNVSVGYEITPNLVQAIEFRRVAKIAQISFSKTLGDRCANMRYFPNICHLPNIGFAQSDSKAIPGIGNVRGPDQGPSMPKMRRNDGVADHRA
jgi:hypothetical protein